MDFQDIQSDDELSDEKSDEKSDDSQNSEQFRVQLRGTHTGATETETEESATAVAEKNKELATTTIDNMAGCSTHSSNIKNSKHVSFVCVEETSADLPTTSKIIDNVKEYVRQIEQHREIVEEQRREESKILTRRPQLQQKIVYEISELPRLKLFETIRLESMHLEERKLPPAPPPPLPLTTLPLADEEQQQRESALQVALIDCNPNAETEEKATFKDVENQEIAERFKQIMEMFDNFTKNLESLEMPALKEPSSSPNTMRKKQDSNWNLNTTATISSTSTPSSSSSSLSSAKIIEPQVHASSYGKYFQDLGATAGESTTEEIIGTVPPAAQESATTTKIEILETIIDMPTPRGTRDTATTMSISDLLGSHMDTMSRRAGAVIDNACQTRRHDNDNDDDDDDYEGLAILPHVHSSSSFSTSRTSHTEMMSNDCKVQTFIFDSAEAAEAIAKNTNNNANNRNIATTRIITTDTTASTIGGSINASHRGGDAGKAKKITPENSGLTLVKITASPSVSELAPLTAAAARVSPLPAPCERTFHTIHIEATSSPSSSVMRRPPLCLRLWNVITDFCAAACLCIQVNKDCLFCLGFFIAFVVSASFLTAFFYRTLSINPQLFQYSQAVEHQQHEVAVESAGKKEMYFSL